MPACSEPLTPDECSQLLDKYTQLLVRQKNAAVTEEELVKARRDARSKAAASRDFSKCGTKLSRRQYRCAMSAPSVDEMERCLL
jgi:hypothetical protein